MSEHATLGDDAPSPRRTEPATRAGVLRRRLGRRAVALLAALAAVLVVLPAGVGTGSASASPRSTGRVALGWGYNNQGVLGNGTSARVARPAPITFPTAFVSVAVGRDHSLAVDAKGRAWAWGRNDRGQLGDGTTRTRLRPVKVKLPKGVRVVQVAAAEDHGLALTSTGRVYAWGANAYGQLGLGTHRDQRRPRRVDVPRTSAVGAGRQTSYAALRAGGLRAWGHNGHGQLGDGSRRDRARPVRVKLGARTRIAQVDAGSTTAIARTTSGRVLAWGDNSDGMVGVSGASDRLRPVQVRLPGGRKARTVSAGDRFAAALTSQGRVVTWGAASSGAELGRGSGAATKPRPVPVPGRVRQVTAGGSHVLALGRNGSVWVWGQNTTHQLGVASDRPVSTPRRVDLPARTHVTSVAAGSFTSYALTDARPKPGRPRSSAERPTSSDRSAPPPTRAPAAGPAPASSPSAGTRLSAAALGALLAGLPGAFLTLDDRLPHSKGSDR